MSISTVALKSIIILLTCIIARNNCPSQLMMVAAGSPTQRVDELNIKLDSIMFEVVDDLENWPPPAIHVM